MKKFRAIQHLLTTNEKNKQRIAELYSDFRQCFSKITIEHHMSEYMIVDTMRLSEADFINLMAGISDRIVIFEKGEVIVEKKKQEEIEDNKNYMEDDIQDKQQRIEPEEVPVIDNDNRNSKRRMEDGDVLNQQIDVAVAEEVPVDNNKHSKQRRINDDEQDYDDKNDPDYIDDDEGKEQQNSDNIGGEKNLPVLPVAQYIAECICGPKATREALKKAEPDVIDILNQCSKRGLIEERGSKKFRYSVEDALYKNVRNFPLSRNDKKNGTTYQDIDDLVLQKDPRYVFY